MERACQQQGFNNVFHLDALVLSLSVAGQRVTFDDVRVTGVVCPGVSAMTFSTLPGGGSIVRCTARIEERRNRWQIVGSLRGV